MLTFMPHSKRPGDDAYASLSVPRRSMYCRTCIHVSYMWHGYATYHIKFTAPILVLWQMVQSTSMIKHRADYSKCHRNEWWKGEVEIRWEKRQMGEGQRGWVQILSSLCCFREHSSDATRGLFYWPEHCFCFSGHTVQESLFLTEGNSLTGISPASFPREATPHMSLPHTARAAPSRFRPHFNKRCWGSRIASEMAWGCFQTYGLFAWVHNWY